MSIFISRFAKDETGATAVEYALIAGLIALALVASLTALQGKIAGTFAAVGAALP